MFCRCRFLSMEKLYFEDITLTQEEFYEVSGRPDADISTSQPSPGDVMELLGSAAGRI